MTHDRAICWIRRDLRLSDHAALAAACAAAREVIPAFIFDTTILDRLEDRDDRRVTFIHRSLRELDRTLRDEYGSMLIVRHGDPRREIPRLAEELGAEAVFINHDYEPAAKERDAAVAEALREAGRTLESFKDQVVYEGMEIVTGVGSPFKVFTPYRNAWLRRVASGEDAIDPLLEHHPDLRRLAPRASIERFATPWSIEEIGFRESTLWLQPGERAARERLEGFMESLDNYHELRDRPALDGTSGLSVHLRFGAISIRELVRRAIGRSSAGARKWLDELIWREFYQMILDCFPHVATSTFRPEYASMRWPGREEHFEAWRQGRTGYPIVDAAMRHFNATGWMHNRLRMIVASFLMKDLLLDYRLGESYFARHLLDFDLASNNGNWQWAASTGCDAQPYFRIFNPIAQSKRFDPDGSFIRRHSPELAGFSDRLIHFPAAAPLQQQRSAGCIVGVDYPAPIVDHAAQRELALQMFRER